jgi:hypothetical protein
MTKEKFMNKCDLCGKQYQNGPNRYGYIVKLYEMAICNSCWIGNHDGFAPHYEDKILNHLKQNNLPVPERNIKGLLPRE